MGGSAWSDDHYSSRKATRAAAGTPTFAYHAATAKKSVDEHKAHESLDPKGIKGKRESRDSDAHPESNAVIFAFDTTGSMSEFPKIAQEKLPTLLGLLLRKGYLTDPAIMVCAFNDQTCCRVPLQVGQFESGIEIEDCLINLFLEGGGGGQNMESPELVFYTAARKTSIDCFEKRGKKGYLFLITDEAGRDLTPTVIANVFGGESGEHLTMEEVVKEAQKMYDVYVITPNATSNYGAKWLKDYWTKLVGQQYLELEDPQAICELVAATIGLCENSTNHAGIADDLAGTGLSTRGVDAVTTALAKPGVVSASRAVAKVPAGSGLATV